MLEHVLVNLWKRFIEKIMKICRIMNESFFFFQNIFHIFFFLLYQQFHQICLMKQINRKVKFIMQAWIKKITRSNVLNYILIMFSSCQYLVNKKKTSKKEWCIYIVPNMYSDVTFLCMWHSRVMVNHICREAHGRPNFDAL